MPKLPPTLRIPLQINVDETKRVYDAVDADDGFRVLADRLWPRGLKKEDAHVDLWAKELAPSTELRKWFNHKAEKFTEFREKYLAELADKQNTVAKIVELADSRRVTLLFAARDPACNHAIVLREVLLASL
ncbi:DUF488 domain-containing protein [Bythopirellula polymerisocia]|uniref:Uroporphyrin-III C-methyltransferase n=1 Tax=Bythopirellula polymerisocia TaxID=2528003 RepID=A0A5C6CVP7_9BACT|nr:DUF488 family protein [Bythopirellula polymerisocia]TWU27905.1 hypothetical protein Pla144_26840 [Bythopirellula polymerisocia]